MKFLELDCDPWREQPFVESDSLAGARMPADDTEAFNRYPEHRWVYDKLRLARSQGIECGAGETAPNRYPAVCKPISSLKRLRAGCRLLATERDHRECCGAGDFWMRYLAGEHISTDLAVVNGDAAWCRHTRAVPGAAGTDYWVIEERSRPRLERFCRDWIRANLMGHTGIVNIETIGGSIISVHLRSAEQWPDLYGRKWQDAVDGLYGRGTWDLVGNDHAEGYSVALFGPPGARAPGPRMMAAIRASVGISSIRLNLAHDRPPAGNEPPAGGLRLAVINSFNLDVALRTRATMARELGVEYPGNSERATA